MSEPCKKCDGTGETVVLVNHKWTGIKMTARVWCQCKKSRYVSDTYKELSSLGEEYMPVERLDQRLVFSRADLASVPNLVMQASTMDTYKLHLKALLMTHWFTEPKPNFLICDTITLLQSFFVEQNDGTSPRLSDVNNYDLVVLQLGTQQSNSKLGTVVAQVVHNRLNYKKPTWFYLPVDNLSQCTQEFSPDLLALINENFKSIMLAPTGMNVTPKISKNKSSAANFNR
jgi:hypothetical protein